MLVSARGELAPWLPGYDKTEASWWKDMEEESSQQPRRGEKRERSLGPAAVLMVTSCDPLPQLGTTPVSLTSQ